MVLCIECSDSTKDGLDRLVADGHCRNYSEAIALAVNNLIVLQSQLGSRDALFLGPSTPRTRTRRGGSQPDKPAKPKVAPAVAEPASAPRSVPELFAQPAVSGSRCTAPVPAGAFAQGDSVPLDRWVFGQFNRLLPAKASCRAMANILLESPNGLELDLVAPAIVEAATELRAWLFGQESRLESHSDEALSTAFPIPYRDTSKSLLRYRFHFIGGTTKAGDLTGLLADLKLINYCSASETLVALTDAGWNFALARNPVLDTHEELRLPLVKFSTDEQEMLLAHIANDVPLEDAAYRAVLDAIARGSATPSDLDEALASQISEDTKGRVSSSFVSTQRSGAISRMSDLGLVSRVRDGVRVTYVITTRGHSYHRSGVPRAPVSTSGAGLPHPVAG